MIPVRKYNDSFGIIEETQMTRPKAKYDRTHYWVGEDEQFADLVLNKKELVEEFHQVGQDITINHQHYTIIGVKLNRRNGIQVVMMI